MAVDGLLSLRSESQELLAWSHWRPVQQKRSLTIFALAAQALSRFHVTHAKLENSGSVPQTEELWLQEHRRPVPPSAVQPRSNEPERHDLPSQQGAQRAANHQQTDAGVGARLPHQAVRSGCLDEDAKEGQGCISKEENGGRDELYRLATDQARAKREARSEVRRHRAERETSPRNRSEKAIPVEGHRRQPALQESCQDQSSSVVHHAPPRLQIQQVLQQEHAQRRKVTKSRSSGSWFPHNDTTAWANDVTTAKSNVQ